MLQDFSTSCGNSIGKNSRWPSSGGSGGFGQVGPEMSQCFPKSFPSDLFLQIIQVKHRLLTFDTPWPLFLLIRNIKETSRCVRSRSILASVDLLLLRGILFKGKSPVANIMDGVTKGNRFSVPVGDSEVCGSWRWGWFEASHPVARAWKPFSWVPALVP